MVQPEAGIMSLQRLPFTHSLNCASKLLGNHTHGVVFALPGATAAELGAASVCRVTWGSPTHPDPFFTRLLILRMPSWV